MRFLKAVDFVVVLVVIMNAVVVALLDDTGHILSLCGGGGVGFAQSFSCPTQLQC